MNFHRTEFVFDCDFDCDCHCFFSKSRFLDCHNDVYTCFDDNISLPEVDHSIAFFLSLFFSLIFDIHFCVSPQIRTSDRFTKPIQSVIWFVIFFWVREGKRTENCSEIATITLHIVDVVWTGRNGKPFESLIHISIFECTHLNTIPPKTHKISGKYGTNWNTINLRCEMRMSWATNTSRWRTQSLAISPYEEDTSPLHYV